MIRPGIARLGLALFLSASLHSALLLAPPGSGSTAHGRRSIVARLLPGAAQGIPAAAPAVVALPPEADSPRSDLTPQQDPGLAGSAAGLTERPSFIEEPLVPDDRIERLREIGDVDLALTVERDGRVSRVEVLRPELGSEDRGWICAMILEARVRPGSVEGVTVGSRWLIRISAPEAVRPATG